MIKAHFSLEVGSLQKVKELSSKLLRYHSNRDKELLAGTNEPKSITGKATAGNNTMDMRMK
jgi:hypothetical protein